VVHLHRVLRQDALGRQSRPAQGDRGAGPGWLDELAGITGKAKSNLSRRLRTMAGYGLVSLERGERGQVRPKATHDRVELDLPLNGARKKAG
jgi:predicted transcriptional regulator